MTKLKWAKARDSETNKLVNDVTTMVYNTKIIIARIPTEADEYMLGSHSVLVWIIDRYQVKKKKHWELSMIRMIRQMEYLIDKVT